LTGEREDLKEWLWCTQKITGEGAHGWETDTLRVAGGARKRETGLYGGNSKGRIRETCTRGGWGKYFRTLGSERTQEKKKKKHAPGPVGPEKRLGGMSNNPGTEKKKD